MADASRALPINQNATRDQLIRIRDWYHNQITFLDHNKGPNRDEKSILRSEGTIRNINKMLITFQGEELKIVSYG